MGMGKVGASVDKHVKRPYICVWVIVDVCARKD